MGDKLRTVPHGGLFHVPKVKYSPETETLIRELIRESRLSIFQRKEVEKSIKNGEPLPLPPKKTGLAGKKKVIPLEELQIKHIIPRRRKLNTIQQSGAFERDTFAPSYVKANHDTEKKKLQEVMAFGRTLKSGKHRKKVFDDGDDDDISNYDTNDICSKESIVQEIMEEIEDRKNFLERMETLGQGKKYKDVIDQEIVGKFRLIEKINNMFKELDMKEGSGEVSSLILTK